MEIREHLKNLTEIELKEIASNVLTTSLAVFRDLISSKSISNEKRLPYVAFLESFVKIPDLITNFDKEKIIFQLIYIKHILDITNISDKEFQFYKNSIYCQLTAGDYENIKYKENINSKYDPLYQYLKSTKQLNVTLTYKEVEEILGFNLPNSAYQHQAWWDGASQHTQSKAWSTAFYTAKPNLKEKKVEFTRL